MSQKILFGRADELLCLNRTMDEMLEGHPQLVFIVGEAGIGKSHLVEELVRQTEIKRPEIVSALGYCNAFFGKTDPLLPFRMIATRLFGEKNEKPRTKTAQKLAKASMSFLWDIAPDAVGVFIPLAGLALKAVQSSSRLSKSTKLVLAEGDSKSGTLVFEQFCRLIYRVTQETPLLLILEDLHWADESTIELLFYLARSWTNQRIMIICTYRADELKAVHDHPLLKVERELKRYNLCKFINPGWLTEDNIRDWLMWQFPLNLLPHDFIKWIHTRTEGNALFVSEILKDLHEQGLIYQTEQGYWSLSNLVQGQDDLPASIASVLDQRFARLEQQLRDILTCASIEGEEFTAQVIASVRKLDEEQVIDTLIDILSQKYEITVLKGEREIAQRRLICMFEFRHSLMQTHVYNSLMAPQKRRLHHHVGECLEELYTGREKEIAPNLARHFMEGQNAKKAYRYAILAADQAESTHDYRTAGQWLRHAINLLLTIDSMTKEQADIWYRIGRSESYTGSFAEAKVCYQKALEFLELTDKRKEQTAEVMADLAYCDIQTDRSYEAIQLLLEAISINRRLGRTQHLAQNMVSLAFAYHKVERQDRANELLLLAGEKFKSLGDLAGQASVHRHLGIHYRIEGKFEECVAHLEEAIRYDRQSGLKFHEASDYTNLGSAYLLLRDDEVQAMGFYQRSLELSRQISKIHEEGHVLLNIARLYALRKDWMKALESVENGLRISEMVRETSNIIRGLWYQGIIRFYLGLLKEAILDYEHIMDIGVHDARLKWAILYNYGSLLDEAEDFQSAFKAYMTASEMVIGIAQEMTIEQRNIYFGTQNKHTVFRALLASAEKTGQLKIAISLLSGHNLADLSAESIRSLPRFYWGGGKWM
jgi:tetratricopeptide (TPR) repeat protein